MREDPETESTPGTGENWSFCGVSPGSWNGGWMAGWLRPPPVKGSSLAYSIKGVFEYYYRLTFYWPRGSSSSATSARTLELNVWPPLWAESTMENDLIPAERYKVLIAQSTGNEQILRLLILLIFGKNLNV